MKKILVVVDYQKDFVDGTLGFPGAELLDAGIASKVRAYGAGNVIYTMDTHSNTDYLNTREGKALPVPHCDQNSEGWQVYGATAEALKEVKALMLPKTTFGVCPELMTDKEIGLPKYNEVEEIELVGLVSNICVISNAVVFQAKYPQAQIIVDASLTASFDPVMNEKVLDVMEGLQVKVINRKK